MLKKLGPISFVFLTCLETLFPLRKSVESKFKRTTRNIIIGTFSFIAIQFIELPVILPLTKWVARNHVGILEMLPLSGWITIALAIACMDYTLYVWHILAHKIPILWRFHKVHHIDLDLDASTAFRFHFAEHLVSIPWRIFQVIAIGVTTEAFLMWQGLLFICIIFHHSNVRIPESVERVVSKLIVTPRMHGIHHSIVVNERNSNWSSGLSIWDIIHRTYQIDINQDQIVIGLSEFQNTDKINLIQIMKVPFENP